MWLKHIEVYLPFIACEYSDLSSVVQSIVSLTSSLRAQLLMQKLLTLYIFLTTKYWHILDINVQNYNETLTNRARLFKTNDVNIRNTAIFFVQKM